MSTTESVSQSPEFRHLHQIFKAWAELTPEAIAIAAPGRAPLTYRRLFAHVETAIDLARRFAHRFTNVLGTLLGLGPERKLRLFLALRACVRSARRLVRGVRGHNRKRSSSTVDLLLDSLSTYIPKPYSGRVALFWPSESGSSAEASRDWRQAVPHIEVQSVPGDHVSCVAVHADVLGDRLKTCLEAAQGHD
jgi:hypothetical protein